MRLNYRLWHKGTALTLAFALVSLWVGLLTIAQAAPAGEDDIIAFKSVSRSIHVERCDRGRCAELDWQTLVFQGQPALNQVINRALWALLENDGSVAQSTTDKPHRAALNDYFQAQAKPGEQIVMQTDLLRQTAQWIVLSVSKYQFEGGAHGISSARFVNWRVTDSHVVTLEDALLPQARADYVAALKQAHQRWIAEQRRKGAIENVSEFVEQWPFETSDDVAFMAEGLRVGYPRYAIAPGSFGEPTLTVPYSALINVIDPALF